MEAEVIAGLIALIASLIGNVVQFILNRSDKEFQRKLLKREKINRQLEEFYKPFLNHLQYLKSLSRTLFYDKPEDFRLLTHLLDKNTIYKFPDGTEHRYELTSHDIVCIEEMLNYYKKIEDIIQDKSSLIDNKILLEEYVPDPKITDIDPQKVSGLGANAILVRHFQLMKSAYEGSIGGNLAQYKDFIYPREINNILQEHINKLEKELMSL